MAGSSKVRLSTKGADKLGAIVREVERKGGVRGNPLGELTNQIGRRYLAFVTRRYIRNSRGGGDWPPLALSTVLRRRKGKGKPGAGQRKAASTRKRKAKAKRDVQAVKASIGRILRGKGKKGSVAKTRKQIAKVLKNARKAKEVKRKQDMRNAKLVGSAKILIDTGGLLSSIQTMSGIKQFSLIPNGIRIEMKGRAPGGKLSYGELARIHHFGLGHVPVRKIYVSPDGPTLKAMAGDAERALRTTNAHVNRGGA